MLQVLSDPDLLREAAEKRRQGARRGDAAADVRRLERLLAQHDRRAAEVAQAFQRGRLSPRAFELAGDRGQRDRALLEQTLRAAQAALADARLVEDEADSIDRLVTALRDRAAAAGPLERRELVRLLVPGRDGLQITMGPRGVVVEGWLDAGAVGVVSASAAGSRGGRREDRAPALRPTRFRVVAR